MIICYVNLACPGGTFGENCTERCNRTCADRKACRNTDGYCVDGCIPGYTGDKCDSSNVYIELFFILI